MRILTAAQLRALDQATIRAEKITSGELMERAAKAFTKAFTRHFPDPERPVVVVCGTGNNGGDGLVVARRLKSRNYKVSVIQANIGTRSADNQDNFKRLKGQGIEVRQLTQGDPWPAIAPEAVVVDALFGTGLGRPVAGYWAELIDYLNALPNFRVAVDLPSGLSSDGPQEGPCVHADLTLCLGLPKLALFAPANTQLLGNWELVTFPLADPDRLHPEVGGGPAYQATLNDASELGGLLKKRYANDHKGTFGHAFLVAGAFGTMGAAVIAGRAVLRAGAGLLTCHIPRSGYEIMQISFPEAMCKVDTHRYHSTEIGDLGAYDSIGIGPGIGQEALTVEAVRSVLSRYERPMVIDADAINIIAAHPELLKLIPKNSLLTPHPKEFARLFGETEHDFARWQVQREVAKRNGLVIVLKTGFTSIATPGGELYFNPTGNPGMGTAGTGDALTGVLTGLLAQGYDPVTAARLGVYLHGLAGDLAAEELSQEFLLAEDVVSHLGQAYRKLRE
ncbi:NAD(P)H-hydrate dehydratase [Neolewinella lacunae]|uniref:Bifunctional NAD(P)H-hydrate repair enzyme n=1 Tax=Neolewinella lacunae TaxID=1517758 RepID=A0A923PMZ5_9BACT|nr:NAD(P)H-hydrate dehydratase [Neolewinella lacunae]MBC6994651.1 NAD(P)H-hydrate dehydratase [Neolewinella lacunae]MDN3634523.1 NAD(P)H-hydrate dehydratase [Neolewinella lacunae]